jgi:hypothetical protein
MQAQARISQAPSLVIGRQLALALRDLRGAWWWPWCAAWSLSLRHQHEIKKKLKPKTEMQSTNSSDLRFGV